MLFPPPMTFATACYGGRQRPGVFGRLAAPAPEGAGLVQEQRARSSVVHGRTPCVLPGLFPNGPTTDGLGPRALYRAQPHPRLTIDPWALVGEQTPLTERVDLLGLLAPLPSELGRIRQKCRKKSGTVAKTQILFLLRPLQPW